MPYEEELHIMQNAHDGEYRSASVIHNSSRVWVSEMWLVYDANASLVKNTICKRSMVQIEVT